MKTKTMKLLSVILALSIIFCLSVSAVASNEGAFDDEAYASVVTGSDFQYSHDTAYNRFTKVLSLMKADGLETPHSMLVGGDYTRLLFDDAKPGMYQIKRNMLSVYPEMDENSIVCIQGNHDNPSAGFTKTGFYDMGAYCLYSINEDDFPWLQYLRPAMKSKIKSLAADIESKLNAMIENGDTRPVFVLTHVPLHHTVRAQGGDNRYASYIFNVLNEAGKKLDVVFLFGHNHSDTYDDYIGGSVNFLQAGDEIRIPDPKKLSKSEYLTETLNFTYLNCGYIGYSGNTVSDTSTNVLTIGCVRIGSDHLRFIKYTEDGVYSVNDVSRITNGEGGSASGATEYNNSAIWSFIRSFLEKYAFIVKLFFAINLY